jgi:hypothetical protein
MEYEFYDRFKYTIFILCNLYGFQLLIINIIKDIPQYDDLFKQINTVINYFRKTYKQLALLRHHQRKLYKDENYALTLTENTR